MMEIDDTKGFIMWVDNEDGTVTFKGKDPRFGPEIITAVIPQTFSEMMDAMERLGRDEEAQEAMGEYFFVPNEPDDLG